MASPLSASIVIVTFNRADSLDRTLGSLHQLRYRNFEVLVVDGPSTDHTRAVVAKHAPFVRSFSHKLSNISISRNIGIAHARGDIVVFIDDDAIPEPDWLDNLLAAYADPQIAAVGGFIRDAAGFDYQSRYTVCDRYGDARQFRAPSEFTLGDETFLSLTGTNFSARREKLIAIGGFDEEYIWFLDETDVNLRMHDRGWKFAVAPDAEIHHKYEAGLTRAISNVAAHHVSAIALEGVFLRDATISGASVCSISSPISPTMSARSGSGNAIWRAKVGPMRPPSIV